MATVPPPRHPHLRPAARAALRPGRLRAATALLVAGVAGGALPSGAVAAGCPGAHRTVAAQGGAEAESAVRCLVNQQRAARGLRALRFDAHAARAAQSHTDDMVRRHYFSHVSPGGSSIADRLSATGMRWRAVGENIAVGQRTPASVVSGWMRSAGHRANILSGTYTVLGVGATRRGTGGYRGATWTQVFARPRG